MAVTAQIPHSLQWRNCNCITTILLLTILLFKLRLSGLRLRKFKLGSALKKAYTI